jgi:cell wall-associated NlpC family hydrolase
MPSVKPAQVTAVRSFHLTNPYMSGPEVEVLQALLAPFAPGAVDGQYGPMTAAAVKQAKWTLGYPDAQVDETAGPKLVAYLQGTPTPADYQARAAARRHDQQKSLTLRDQIVAVARWGIANEPQIHYEQSRPIDGLHDVHKLPLRTDCSGFATLCYCWAGAPDPNGNGYNGQGYTGTLLKAMRHIPPSAVQPGDLVVWGAYPGKHVALVIGIGADPQLASHGQERGPLAIAFSDESRYQKAAATWLSSLP